MQRLILLPLMVAIFLGWVIYRIVIKNDMKEHMNELYIGGFFVLVWMVILWFVY